MSIANRILKLIHDKPLSIKQINTRLSELPETTIYGRVSELKTRKLVKKIGGKFVITDKGKTYINKFADKIVFKEQVEYNYEIEKPGTGLQDYLYHDDNYDPSDTTAWNITDTIVKIYAKNNQQAYNLAKVIYGSEVEIRDIE